jgi:hypothetical protein
LRGAVAKNAAELCTLTGGPLENCNVELKDMGVATPTVRPFRPEQPQETDMQTANMTNVIIVVSAIAGLKLLLFAVWVARSRQTKEKYGTQDPNAAHNKTAESKVTVVTASMEEGKSVEEKKPVEDDDNNSTLCPSNSDKQSDKHSEPSICGDVENASTPEQGLSVVKALSDSNL